MNGIIDIERLLAMIADPDVSPNEYRSLIRPIDDRQNPFSLEFSVNRELVNIDDDVRGNFLSRQIIAAAMRRRQRIYRRKVEGNNFRFRLLSEGDSWFQYPEFATIDGWDVIDYLPEDYAIFCRAFSGDTMTEKVSPGHINEMKNLIQSENFNAILVSGGGNDLVGRDIRDTYGQGLSRFIIDYEEASEEAREKLWISDRYEKFLGEIMACYEQFFHASIYSKENIVIFVHGYDYAFPQEGGPWLYPALVERGIPEEFWTSIIHRLLEKFNRRLNDIASMHSNNVVYVNCIGAVGDRDEWRDELHAKKDGCVRVAGRFSSLIDKHLSNQ